MFERIEGNGVRTITVETANCVRATSRLQEIDCAKLRGRRISRIAAGPNAFWTTRHPLPTPQPLV